MKSVLSLLLLLSLPIKGATPAEAPPPRLLPHPAVTARVVDAGEPARGDEIVAFDSYTGAASSAVMSGPTGRFVGMPFDLEAEVGNAPISRIVVYLAHTATTTQRYDRLRVRVRLWNGWSPTGQPVFANAAGPAIERDVQGPVTLDPMTLVPVELRLDPPVALSALTGHGIAINFQGDTGSGMVSADTLNALLRYGPVGFAAGANANPGTFGYHDVDGRGDFNFAPGDFMTSGLENEGIALRMYAIDSRIEQEIANFAADPADPVVGDGHFTVSATGGASGNPVTFSVDPASAAVCTAGGAHGATITMFAIGVCNVHADQAGNAAYRAAAQESLSLTIRDELVRDGGFEGVPGSTYWTQASNDGGVPPLICDTSCGGPGGPRTGTRWVWFGNTIIASERSVEQTGTIVVGARTLSFHLWWQSIAGAPPDGDAEFDVTVDGDTLFTVTPATAAPYRAGYTRVPLDISAYADGGIHTVRFESNTGFDVFFHDIHLDDIDIDGGDRIFANGFEPTGR